MALPGLATGRFILSPLPGGAIFMLDKESEVRSMAKRDSGWWDDFFPTFRPVFDVVSPKSTNAQVRFIIKRLGLRPGMSFLDCPCGIGRIALPLAKKGINVTGVDIMRSYLDEMQTKAKRRNLKMKSVQCDMRRIDFHNEFDAAGNLWTSLGFFDKESDDILTIKKMYQALKPGGKFLLHLINHDWLMANYQTHGWFQAGGVKILQENGFDYRTSRSIGKWYFIKDGVEKSYEVPLRIYAFHELVRIFERVGFVDIDGYAGVSDKPPSRDMHMMSIIGRKPR
jgi:2-polyprenyl-3-methyl-5-hydroxy-6-metoxy-1,4-benzoquinol methylase